MQATSSTVAWAFLAAGLTLVVILLAFGAALVIYQRRFLRMHREYADGLLNAQEQERAWVAQEVHDDALQRIAMVLHELDDCAAQANGSAATQQRLGALRAELEDLSAVLRQLAYRLHPAFVEQEGIVIALRRLTADVTRAGRLEVTLVDETAASPPLTREQALVVYRIAQEALNNLARHADSPTAVVRVHASNGTLELFVDDKGRGFDVEAARGVGGLGLVSMTERARAAGGTLAIASAAGSGTSVHLRLPIGGSS